MSLTKDSKEIKQMRTFIEELNKENHQLINDLQDCMEEYEKLSSSASNIEKEKAALVKLIILVTDEQDEQALLTLSSFNARASGISSFSRIYFI